MYLILNGLFKEVFFSLSTSLSLYDANHLLTTAGDDFCMIRLISFSSSDDNGSVSFAI